MELVSLNIRGAVVGFSDYVTPYEAYMSWSRHGFLHPDYPDPAAIKGNPTFYDATQIISDFSRSVRWAERSEAARGLKALTQVVRYADYDQWDDEVDFRKLLDDLRIACEEDGFLFELNPRRIDYANTLPLDEFNLEGLNTVAGVLVEVKKINRALVKDRVGLPANRGQLVKLHSLQ